MTSRPRNIANDILDAVETATARWTKQKKSEERTPGNVRYRRSRMTKEPSTSQKDAAWEIMEEAYMAASARRHAARQCAAESSTRRGPRSWR